jgi:hypothetical protein
MREPVLGFPGGALVHFVVSQNAVMMSNRLAGPATHFLPFNRGNQGGAGNASNPDGFATAYLWGEVWARESWLDILQPLLASRAKAMVVVSSRREAVRWQKEMRSYIQGRNYPLGVLVAFSGEANDPDSFPEPVSETSTHLNPGLKGRDIRESFAGPDYQLLLVANKFQPGFDQPLLCGMYVEKMLGGIQAVQTLSRLNRAHPGKDTTYILDS